MAIEDTPSPEIARLNAFVDGELTPAERAAVAAQIRAQPNFARAHATLARLKACIAESADATPSVAIARPPRRSQSMALGIGVAGLAAVAFGLVGLLIAVQFRAERKPVPLAGQEAVVTLAALPANPVLPHLDAAGLVLEDVAVEGAGNVRLLLASYRGPHGCRLDLRVSPAGSAAPVGAGSGRHSWEVGALAYELVAHGMPGWRFAIIAAAAEQETRAGRAPDAARRRLREARASAPPCTG
jgi:anti-sigma factor RsiW